MRYWELLSNYIDKSGLSLAEIVEKMQEKEIKIDRSYISKLKNGTKPPASVNVTRALADVTGGDPEELITAAYLDKAPDEIRSKIEEADNVDELLNDAIRDYIENVEPLSVVDDWTRKNLFQIFKEKGFKFDENNLDNDTFKELVINWLGPGEKLSFYIRINKKDKAKTLIAEEKESYDLINKSYEPQITKEEQVFFKDYEKLSVEDKRKVLEHIKFLRHLANEQNEEK
jgi:transcriptional regulator with XRE-family HTH domain